MHLKIQESQKIRSHGKFKSHKKYLKIQKSKKIRSRIKFRNHEVLEVIINSGAQKTFEKQNSQNPKLTQKIEPTQKKWNSQN